MAAGRERCNVNVPNRYGTTAIHCAYDPDILNALIKRGADPTLPDSMGETPIMRHIRYGDLKDSAARLLRLLEDPRVRATITSRDNQNPTALELLGRGTVYDDDELLAITAGVLLQAGAAMTVDGRNFCALRRRCRPHHRAFIAILKQGLEAEKAALLVMGRRLVLAANQNAEVPSCLQCRVVLGQPLPCVTLTPPTDDYWGEEERCKLRTLLAFLTRMQGGVPDSSGSDHAVLGSTTTRHSTVGTTGQVFLSNG